MEQLNEKEEKDTNFHNLEREKDPRINSSKENHNGKDFRKKEKENEEKPRMEKTSLEVGKPHRRYNPLTGEWILVCPHRLQRPWSGQEEPATLSSSKSSSLETENVLSPGAIRANGLRNPNYSQTYVFTNDFPALLEEESLPPSSLMDGEEKEEDANDDPLFQWNSVQGTCRVMCFHPSANRTLALLSIEELETVIGEWKHQLQELSSKYRWIQIFENKGASMGCSNPFPHCQIWACSYLPTIPALKDRNLLNYYEKYGRPLLDDYITRELERKERIVIENIDWLVVVPYWASWPFETMIISRNRNKRLTDLNKEQEQNLAKTMKELLIKYDNLFRCSFPYSMGFHGAPTGSNMKDSVHHWTLHAIYYPPLLRSAAIRKFMVGFELLGETQRDLTPEKAAQCLRECNGHEHYTMK